MLELTNVTKIFNRGTINEKCALNNVSLTVNDGDFITIIGGNGAGKSTLLNTICGVFPVDSGKIVLNGKDITKLSDYRRAKYLGRVFQDPMMGTAPKMSIQENLALASRRVKKSVLPEKVDGKRDPKEVFRAILDYAVQKLRPGISKKDRETYREMLKSLGLGLEDRMKSKVGLLSGGQRQSLTLLMATLQRPEILLLDEHTAALDPKTAAKVLELTEEITGEANLTTVMITHNMRDALRCGNRLIMMHEGRIIYDVCGEEKKNLTVEDLLKKFEETNEGVSDKILLS